MSASDVLAIITVLYQVVKTLATNGDVGPDIKRLNERVNLRFPHWKHMLKICELNPDKFMVETEFLRCQSLSIQKNLLKLAEKVEEKDVRTKIKNKVFHKQILEDISALDESINTFDNDFVFLERSVKNYTNIASADDKFEKLLSIVLFMESSKDSLKARFERRPTWTAFKAVSTAVVGFAGGSGFGPIGSVVMGTGSSALAHAIRMDDRNIRLELQQSLFNAIFQLELISRKIESLLMQVSKQVLLTALDRTRQVKPELVEMLRTMDDSWVTDVNDRIKNIDEKAVEEYWSSFDKPLAKEKSPCVIS